MTKTVVHHHRLYKLCPLCNGRYLVPDIKHLDSGECMVRSVARTMHTRGWAKCGSAATVIARAGIPTEVRVSSYMGSFAEFSKARWAPAWAVPVAELYAAPPVVRVWWLLKLAAMPDAERTAVVAEIKAVRQLGGDLIQHCYQRFGEPEKRLPAWWKIVREGFALTPEGEEVQSL